jgi:hypothetical protein
MNLEEIKKLPYVQKVEFIENDTLDDISMKELIQDDREVMPIVAVNPNISQETATIIYDSQCYKSLIGLSKNSNKQNLLSQNQLSELDRFVKNRSFQQHYNCTTCDEREQIDCLVGKANKAYEDSL